MGWAEYAGVQIRPLYILDSISALVTELSVLRVVDVVKIDDFVVWTW